MCLRKSKCCSEVFQRSVLKKCCGLVLERSVAVEYRREALWGIVVVERPREKCCIEVLYSGVLGTKLHNCDAISSATIPRPAPKLCNPPLFCKLFYDTSPLRSSTFLCNTPPSNTTLQHFPQRHFLPKPSLLHDSTTLLSNILLFFPTPL